MSEQMDMGEIEENMKYTEEGDQVRVVVQDLGTFEGEARSVKTNIRNNEFSVFIETNEGEMFSVKGDVSPPEPNVGIPNPYLDGIYVQGLSPSRQYVDAYEVINE